MSTEYRPQETSMNSLADTERRLHNSFMNAGFDNELAEAVARTFTQYMLSYWTEEGAAQNLVKHGASESTARVIVQKFRALKRQTSEEVSKELATH